MSDEIVAIWVFGSVFGCIIIWGIIAGLLDRRNRRRYDKEQREGKP